MLPILARSYDSLFTSMLGRFVGRPRGRWPQPESVPARPEDIVPLGPLQLRFEPREQPGAWNFQAEAPVPSFWKEGQVLRGRALGDPACTSALLILHGAYENEYTFTQWMAQPFVQHGYRVLIPPAPCHLERAAPTGPSGTQLFWSAHSVVAGLAQWLAEIRGLIDWLHAQGVHTVGLMGYSLGSLTAGLAATLWSDLDFVVLLAPVGHHLQAIQHSHLAGNMWRWMKRLPPAEAALLDRWSAIQRQPLVSRLLFLITLHDNLQPTALQWAWWRAWQQPPQHTYPTGHLSVVFSRQLYRDLDRYAAAIGTGPPKVQP